MLTDTVDFRTNTTARARQGHHMTEKSINPEGRHSNSEPVCTKQQSRETHKAKADTPRRQSRGAQFQLETSTPPSRQLAEQGDRRPARTCESSTPPSINRMQPRFHEAPPTAAAPGVSSSAGGTYSRTDRLSPVGSSCSGAHFTPWLTRAGLREAG